MSQQPQNELLVSIQNKKQVQSQPQGINENQKPRNPFGSEKATLNIFAKGETLPPMDLFANKEKTINLFSLHKKPQEMKVPQEAQNIFDLKVKPIIEKPNEDSQSSATKSNTKSFSVEPKEQVMKYTYDNQTKKIGQFEIFKFKHGNSTPKEEIYITLEQPQSLKECLYIVVRNNKTKLPIYRGIFLKNVSKIDHFMGKQDILRLQIVKKQIKQSNSQENSPSLEIQKQKNSESTQNTEETTYIKEVVKIQFLTPEHCKQCEKNIKEYKM